MKGPEFIARFPALETLAQVCAKEATFRATFGTEEACRRWFFRARWPNGFECPTCGHRGSGRMNARGWIECSKCRKQTSLTSGTLLHGTRKPVSTWFEAAYLIVHRGVNARTLQRKLGLTYKVAWTWGHKLRAAMKNHTTPENALPEECVHLEASRTPRGWVQAPDPKLQGPCGCTKLTRRDWKWPDELEEERAATRAESRYRRGIRDPEVLIPEDYPPPSRGWVSWDLLATFKGCLSEKHLRAYLDENAFRDNRRRRPARESFAVLMGATATTQPLSYRKIVARPKLEGYPLSIFRGVPRPTRGSAPPRGDRREGSLRVE
jgi:hypothetical protein